MKGLYNFDISNREGEGVVSAPNSSVTTRHKVFHSSVSSLQCSFQREILLLFVHFESVW